MPTTKPTPSIPIPAARAAKASAQAKVNLLLRVLGRETSGYHQIETVFQRIDLADSFLRRPAPGRHASHFLENSGVQ